MVSRLSIALLLALFFLATVRSEEWTDTDTAVIQQAVDAPERPAGDRARDAARKPVEVLSFFGIKPGMRIADLLTGTGYYSEIASRIVGETGKVYWHNSGDKYKHMADAALQRRLDVAPLPNIERADSELNGLEFPGEKLDAVFLFLIYHDTYIMPVNRDAMNKAIYDALKPGGIYCIIDHEALRGTADFYAEPLHRIEGELVKAEIRFAGFEFEQESDVLRNPDDNMRMLSYGREMRGKTNRFIYRFRKPMEGE